jgi:hypothetical protein
MPLPGKPARRKCPSNLAFQHGFPLGGAWRIKAESLEPTSEIVNPPHMIGFMESMY